MWQDGFGTMAVPTTPWASHHRFLRDLFAVACPSTIQDLTSGEAATVALSIHPTAMLVERGPADLLLAEGSLPQPGLVGPDTLVLIRNWDGSGTAVALPNGLALVSGSRWRWLGSDEVTRWLRAYTIDQQDAELDFLRGQTGELQEMVQAQQQRVEVLERELLSARDEVAQLLPLEVSPKAQLYALRRSIPVSLRKRVPRRRGAARRDTPPKPVDTQLLRLKGVSLDDVLRTQFDAEFAAMSSQQYLTDGLWAGRAVNPAHEAALRPVGPAEIADPGWGPVELVTPEGRWPGSLGDLVDQVAPDLLTVDIWDTLIVRDRPADAAKLASARRLVLQPAVAGFHPELDVFDVMALRVRVEAVLAATDPGQEYLLEDVMRATMAELGLEDASLLAALVEAEVADEIAWTRARPDVAALAVRDHVAIVSDFYMTGAQLRRVVSAADPRWAELPVYVSVERGCSKRLGGGLLDLARRDAGVTPSAHVHVGDNVHSDVTMQVKAGGAAVQVQARTRFPAPGQFGPDDLPACDAELLRRVAEFDRDNPTQDLFRLAGRHAARLAVAVVARGLEQAYRDGVDRVHYVSREGIFLAQVHRAVESVLRPPGAQPVAAVHLALSRRATFGASLQAPYRFSLQRMWSMYARQSPRAMLVSIGVDPQDYTEELAHAGLDLDAILTDARRDQRVEAFLADPAVEGKLSAHVTQARDLLGRYVLDETRITSPFIVVDVGWRGTIQDNLVRALRIPSSVGVYFGLFPFLNAQPTGSRKTGVAFDGNLGEGFAFADPPAVLERPWTPDVPSTIGFTEQQGRVLPQFDKEAGHVSAGIAAFQDGSLEAAQVVAQWLVGFGLTTTALRPQIARWARDLWERPPVGVAEIWFSSDHDDSFGALNHTEFGKDRPGPQWVSGDLYQHIRRGMDNSGWPQGYRAWRPVASLIELGNLA